MQDVKEFLPNWNAYWVLLAIFSMLTAALHGLFEFSLPTLLCFLALPILVFSYLILNQNKLVISATQIKQHFVLPLQAGNTIELDKIDWIALDNRELFWPKINLLRRSCVIIKLKNDSVVSINLAFLNDQEELSTYFLQLSNQMADHDTELFKLKDLHGFNQLAIDATLGLTNLVEAMHQNITRLPGITAKDQANKTAGLSSSIYKGIKVITGLAGGGIDELLAQIAPILNKNSSAESNTNEKQIIVSYERAALLSALNGVMGDYMVTTNNPMTIPMRLRRNGHSLKLSSDALIESIQPITGKLLVMVHGLCMNDLQWHRKGHDHGASLAQDLGYTPVYLRYNTGQHISTNGRAFSDLLEVLVKLWPESLEDMVIIGHSMGGLVTRSAYHYGALSKHKWVNKVQRMIFLGSPHHGAPLERGGNWIDTILGSTPYTAPLARLGKIRSSGITDLRHGNVIDEHWQGRDRFEPSQDIRKPVPLPQDARCFTVAGTTGNKVGDLIDQLLGDGLVQVDSALGKHKNSALCLDLPPERQLIAYGVNHMDLLNDPEVYNKIKQWLC